MNGSKNYTVKDIERYHKGLLSAAEMHALEKATLDDPFLADALEGYAATPTPAADMDVLRQRLQFRIEKDRKRRGIIFLQQPWMRVAALLLLFAGAGWLTLHLLSPGEPGLATAPVTETKQPSLPAPQAADSVTVSTDAPVTAQAPVQPRPSAPAAKGGSVRRENEASRQVTEPVTVSTQGREAKDVPLETLAKAEPRAVTAPVGSDSISRQIAGAVRGLQVTDIAKQNDVAFRKEAAAPAARQRLAPPTTDTIRNFNISMRRDTTGLNEVVVVGYGAQRAKKSYRDNIRVDSLEPAEGWSTFDDYIASHLQEPEELKTKGLAGEVELAFDVNKEGQAVNIKVTKSLCEKCDEEAVRLLKEGPKWKKGKKKGKIKIKFPPSP